MGYDPLTKLANSTWRSLSSLDGIVKRGHKQTDMIIKGLKVFDKVQLIKQTYAGIKVPLLNFWGKIVCSKDL